jgi:putative nucleotidyltransferase with HDIG domain
VTTATALALLPPAVRDLIEKGQEAEREARKAEARELYEEALRALPSSNHPETASALLRWIARTHDGDPWAALEITDVAIAVAEAAGDRNALASGLNSRAAILFGLGELDEAVKIFETVRGIASWEQAWDLVAMVEQNLGNIASIRGDLPKALELFQSSLAGYRRLCLDDYVGPLLNNIGRLQTELGDWQSAERTFDEARKHCKERHDRVHEVVVEVNRTRLYVQRGWYRQAQDVGTRALALAEDADEDRWAAEIFRNLGVVHRELDEREESARLLARARSLAEARGDAVVMADVAREQAVLFHAMGRNSETLRALNDAHRLFEQLRARIDLRDIDQRLKDLEEQFLTIVREWGESIERKDSYTQGHCDRVATYACSLALAAGMSSEDIKWFKMGAFLHDVGKVSVPPEILNKPDQLTAEERAVMARHPAEGVALLAGIEFPWDIRPMILHHHERWDGSGYPNGLGHDDIPMAARILTIADVYDALTTTRSYREAFSPRKAWEIMSSETGRTFDPDLLPLFKPVVDAHMKRAWVRVPQPRRGLALYAGNAT